MIAALWRPGGINPPKRSAVARALQNTDGLRVLQTHCDTTSLFGALASANDGLTTLLFGRIDNSRAIANTLKLPGDTDSKALYAAALARWGDGADDRLIGHYCAITVEGPGRLRLVRSPWTAPPLHFHTDDKGIVASPLLSALFSAGVRQEIDWDYLADQLAFDHHDCEPVGWYKNIGRVPLGSRVHINPDGWTLDRYYDPVCVPEVSGLRDEDYVERAQELLGEAAQATLAGLIRPAIMLSGGLDSPLAAAALLRARPEARLHSVTFAPHPQWDGMTLAHRFGEETDKVRAFAAMHPRLVPLFPDPSEGGHDHRLRDLLAHMRVPTANIANVGSFHGCFETARKAGCDGVLTALHGNFTISLDADWAAAKAVRRGRWRKAWKLVRDLPDHEGHGPLRRLLSMGFLPNLPASLQHTIRRAAHPDRFDHVPLATLLTARAAQRWQERAKARGATSVFDEPPIHASRAQAIRAMWKSADSGEDLDLGLARLHGMAHRDVTAYRPLIEFCHGLPTEQLRRGAIDRYLARRMARGLMPEAQRLDHRQGRHNADWHARLALRRRELITQVAAIRSHPQLGALLDTKRMTSLLEDWPDETPIDPRERWPREVGLTRALTAAAFVSHVELRNDF